MSTTEKTITSVIDTIVNKTYVVRTTEIPVVNSQLTAMDPLSHVGDGIFLQTKTAQGIAGAFVWVALFLTCQQVCLLFVTVLEVLNKIHCFPDLSTFTMVYKSSRTKMDC